MPKAKFPAAVAAIRTARDKRGLSNGALCREVRDLVRQHNETPGREPIELAKAFDERDYTYWGNEELKAIRNGTRKILAAYLAWLWEQDEDAARALYIDAGLTQPAASPAAEQGADGKHAPWQRVMNRFGRFESLEVISLDTPSLGLIGLKNKEPVADRRLRLGEPFCFRINAPEGYIIALQRFRGTWYPMALTEGGWHDRLTTGNALIPCDTETGGPVELSEEANPGKYGFGFVILNDDRLTQFARGFREEEPLTEAQASELEKLLQDQPTARQIICRINVEICA